MAYKLVIEDTVKVPIKFSLNSNGRVIDFSHTLICDRLGQDAIRARMEDKSAKVRDFMLDVSKGWEGQTLIVDESGRPADFSKGALEIMLDTAGVASVSFAAYLKEVGAKEKN